MMEYAVPLYLQVGEAWEDSVYTQMGMTPTLPFNELTNQWKKEKVKVLTSQDEKC